MKLTDKPALQKLLAKCGLFTWQDVLFYFPRKYQDRAHIVPIADLLPGDVCQIEGIIIKSEVQTKGRKNFTCVLQDSSSELKIRFFYFYPKMTQTMTTGVKLRCYGELREYHRHRFMVHPEYQIVTDTLTPLQSSYTPIYPLTEGLTQKQLWQITDLALKQLKQTPLTDWIPENLREKFQWLELNDVILRLHRPSLALSPAALNEHSQRLIKEELLAHYLYADAQRKQLTHLRAKSLPLANLKDFIGTLPFSLTNAQQKVSQEIAADLNQTIPMLRLVQGDVGSGKTVIAALAALQAIQAGSQVALMAPTEILAEQHFHKFQLWFSPLNISVALLKSATQTAEKKHILQALANNQIHLLIGTHALFQENVQFKQLDLIIIDEQHRFGVEQRLALRKKGEVADVAPHQLVLTATPIPRTLAMTLYADLAISIIDELPAGRQAIQTLVMPTKKRGEVIERIRNFCQSGQQIYWVCTLIMESEQSQYQAAEKTFALLTTALPELNIGLIHGQMKPAEKEKIMHAFKHNKIQVLVATTVIEVGVDVPNANLMVIENAERLGLSQLHQLRGRVGRSAAQSYCILLFGFPLSNHAKQRLEIMRVTTDGFVIAEKDLSLRGSGELWGKQQSGDMAFTLAEIGRDHALLPEIHAVGQVLLKDYPDHCQPIIERWLSKTEAFIRV